MYFSRETLVVLYLATYVSRSESKNYSNHCIWNLPPLGMAGAKGANHFHFTAIPVDILILGPTV